ncbi:hypothetical protein RRG08_003999 [Elysia crispata]|uniref:Uncharacterized protein n=1 Tax=Elysia crispata TaxID=231223 RepID=A0AAE1CT34_9GAST|nr:hypothetical protein RRG08_003999 [Elysia crispata]
MIKRDNSGMKDMMASNCLPGIVQPLRGQEKLARGLRLMGIPAKSPNVISLALAPFSRASDRYLEGMAEKCLPYILPFLVSASGYFVECRISIHLSG